MRFAESEKLPPFPNGSTNVPETSQGWLPARILLLHRKNCKEVARVEVGSIGPRRRGATAQVMLYQSNQGMQITQMISSPNGQYGSKGSRTSCGAGP